MARFSLVNPPKAVEDVEGADGHIIVKDSALASLAQVSKGPCSHPLCFARCQKCLIRMVIPGRR